MDLGYLWVTVFVFSVCAYVCVYVYVFVVCVLYMHVRRKRKEGFKITRARGTILVLFRFFMGNATDDREYRRLMHVECTHARSYAVHSR